MNQSSHVPQIKHLINMLEILPQLLMTWKPLRPIPSPPNFWKGKLIIRNLRIHSGTWISIPMPNTTNGRSSFKYVSFKSLFAKLMECVTTTEAGANNENVQVDVLMGRRGDGTHDGDGKG